MRLQNGPLFSLTRDCKCGQAASVDPEWILCRLPALEVDLQLVSISALETVTLQPKANDPCSIYIFYDTEGVAGVRSIVWLAGVVMNLKLFIKAARSF